MVEFFYRNPRVSCQSMPQIDLGKWRENLQECDINGRSVKLGESSLPSPCTSCVCTIEGVNRNINLLRVFTQTIYIIAAVRFLASNRLFAT